MPWLRSNEFDPLEQRRRELAEQERLLSERVTKLTADLRGESSALPKQAEPPIWRREDDHPPQTWAAAEPATQRRRGLARQRQRDMILFFARVTLLLMLFAVVLWIFYTHYQTNSGG